MKLFKVETNAGTQFVIVNGSKAIAPQHSEKMPKIDDSFDDNDFNEIFENETLNYYPNWICTDSFSPEDEQYESVQKIAVPQNKNFD